MAALDERIVSRTGALSGDDSQFGAERPHVELIVKSSDIEAERIGADLFCQEFWMELYALHECTKVPVCVKTVKVNSEAFKKNFSHQPPILVEVDEDMNRVLYTDNQEVERSIFKIANQNGVALFNKDVVVAKKIEGLFRNFKVFLQRKVEAGGIRGLPGSNVPYGYSQSNGAANANGHAASASSPVADPAERKLLHQLSTINELLEQRQTRYLVHDQMTQYDCELMPRLHHIRIAGEQLAGFQIPHAFVHLWNYILTAYRTAAFIESCPADQDILYHYKEQLHIPRKSESLQAPTKNHTIPEDVLDSIKGLKID